MASEGASKKSRPPAIWGIVLFALTFSGCGENDSSAPIMVERKHTHYHVHAVDASHDHSHGDDAVGGHAHSHRHSEKGEDERK